MKPLPEALLERLDRIDSRRFAAVPIPPTGWGDLATLPKRPAERTEPPDYDAQLAGAMEGAKP